MAKTVSGQPAAAECLECSQQHSKCLGVVSRTEGGDVVCSLSLPEACRLPRWAGRLASEDKGGAPFRRVRRMKGVPRLTLELPSNRLRLQGQAS